MRSDGTVTELHKNNPSLLLGRCPGSPLFVHACDVGPEGHGALKLAGVDQGEDAHGVYDHRHPEVLEEPSPPLKVHLDITKHVYHV